MRPGQSGSVLVIGYGNPLCGDDGVGPAVVERVAAEPTSSRVDVRVLHQLTPELARDVAMSSLTVLVDAETGAAAGEIVVARVDPHAAAAPAWSHHVDPAGLAGLALELFGRTPPVFTVGVGVASTTVGDGMSPVVAAAVPKVADAVRAIVAAHDNA